MKQSAHADLEKMPLTRTVPGFSVVVGVHAPASVLERHTHEQATICAVQRGSFTEYYPGRAVACDARTLKLTPAGEPHWNRFDAVATRGLRIDVDTAQFQSDTSVRRLLDERVFVRAEAFAPLMRGITREIAQWDEYSSISLESLLLELLARLGRGARLRGDHPPAWLARADEMVRSLYRERLTVAGLAAEVGVEPTTLARGFRRIHGCTVGQRIRQLRLDYAARELLASRAPIASIAVRAGFYDQSHFSNAFRSRFGTTPAAYRRQAPGASLHDDDTAHEGVRAAQVVMDA